MRSSVASASPGRPSEGGVGDEAVKKETWTEEYEFRCRRCGDTWKEAFEVRRYTGIGGHEWMVYCRNGRPIRPPHHDLACAGCGGLRVRVLPLRSGCVLRLDGGIEDSGTSSDDVAIEVVAVVI